MKELAEKTGITQSFNRYMVECEFHILVNDHCRLAWF